MECWSIDDVDGVGLVVLNDPDMSPYGNDVALPVHSRPKV